MSNSASAVAAFCMTGQSESLPITTDTNGLTAGEIKLDTRDGPIPAYRAVPEKNGKYPVVLVVQEIWFIPFQERRAQMAQQLLH